MTIPTTPERWRRCPSHPNYEVSDLGRVRRASTGPNTWVGRILKIHVNSKGYTRYTLTGDRRYFAHRLVLEAFVGPCPDGHECSHLNDAPSDNRLVNLAWETRAANLARIQHAVGEARYNAKLTAADVLAIRASSLSNRALARAYGVCNATIGEARLRKTWKHI